MKLKQVCSKNIPQMSSKFYQSILVPNYNFTQNFIQIGMSEVLQLSRRSCCLKKKRKRKIEAGGFLQNGHRHPGDTATVAMPPCRCRPRPPRAHGRSPPLLLVLKSTTPGPALSPPHFPRSSAPSLPLLLFFHGTEASPPWPRSSPSIESTQSESGHTRSFAASSSPSSTKESSWGAPVRGIDTIFSNFGRRSAELIAAGSVSLRPR